VLDAEALVVWERRSREGQRDARPADAGGSPRRVSLLCWGTATGGRIGAFNGPRPSVKGFATEFHGSISKAFFEYLSLSL